MKTIEMHDARSALADYAPGVRLEPLLVTRRGKPVMAIFSVEGVDRETLALSTNPEFLAILERSEARYRAEGGFSTEEIRRQLSLSPVTKKRTKRK
jgi:PHD/YefM family antitoxin component YafN of YafNO toxin-antitoxin module